MVLRLGILGMSEGNGHPYSWSAIFNGYDVDAIADCPFPAIPAYLAEKRFPEDAIEDAKVTHVWTQDRTLSKHIARACRIQNVVDEASEMIGQIDGILLARDDAENHFLHAEPFIHAGLPIYIDKPFALSLEEAIKLYDLEQYAGQIFTCSALRYANEFKLSQEVHTDIGDIRYIQATSPKDWDHYAVHIIEPVLLMLGRQERISGTKIWRIDDMTMLHVQWESGRSACFTTLGGNIAGPIALRLNGLKGYCDAVFHDSFSAFKTALTEFLHGIKEKRTMISRDFVLDVVTIIEAGRQPC